MRAFFQPKYKQLSDEDLAKRSASGDERAFAALYDRFSKPLLLYFMKMLRNDRELAEDQVQDVFMKWVNKPELYDTTRSFKTWIFSVAHNQCKNIYRHEAVVDSASSTIALDLTVIDFAHSERSHDLDAFQSALTRVLGELDLDRKTTFLLRYEQELSIKEISDCMQCSEGTVKSRLFYTLKLLSERLGAYKNLLFTDKQ
jgi:RNA polymerase sigma-70 factor (ECF subfamily)